jgi:hypothetical protein
LAAPSKLPFIDAGDCRPSEEEAQAEADALRQWGDCLKEESDVLQLHVMYSIQQAASNLKFPSGALLGAG